MLRFMELIIAAFAFVMLTNTNAYYPFIGIPPESTPEDLLVYQDTIRNILLLPYLAVVILVALHWKKMILGMAAVWPIVLMVLFAWLSTLWSVDPETTYRRSIALTITTLMGIYLFVRFDLRDLLRFLVPVFGIIIVASLAWVFLFPEYGQHVEDKHVGAWRGIFFHKNWNGRVMVFALPAIIAAVYSGYVSRPFGIIVGLLAMVVLVGSTSQTSLLAVLAVFFGFTTVFMVRGATLKSAFITLTVFAIVWHVSLGIYFSYETILEALGRDPTLTGRTEIWEFVLNFALQRPLTGFGYEAFWLGERSPGAVMALEWGISDSHNGWLEIFVSLGGPIILLLLIALITTVFRGVILARYSQNPAPAILIMTYIFALTTIAMSESVFLVKHSIDWMMMVAVAGCARALTSRLVAEDTAEIRPAASMPSRHPIQSSTGYY